MLILLATIFALKLVEGTGSLEFDGWDDVLGAAVACWLGNWAAQAVLGMAFVDTQTGQVTMSLWVTLTMEAIAQMAVLLVAAAVLTGFRIRRFYGPVLAGIAIVGLSYAVMTLIPPLGLPF